MARYVLIALNGPTAEEGDEQVYNTWYDQVHVADLLASPGVLSAVRYRAVQGDLTNPYVAIYEIESEDIGATLRYLQEHNTPFHPTFDLANSRHILAVALPPPEPPATLEGA